MEKLAHKLEKLQQKVLEQWPKKTGREPDEILK